MSLASILRSLGGRETPPPIPRKRRFDAEMPDLPDDMMAEQDYDPQDLDPTQGIGRSEDLYQDKGPQKMTPISEDIPENGPPPFGPDKPPSRFRQAAMAAIPAMIRGGIVAASSPTRGQIGTAGDIFGSMRAVMDDRQQQDILAHNMRRQAARDAQDAEYNAARTQEQRARAQMEQARAEDYARGRGKNPQNMQESLAEQERILGRPFTERERQTFLKLYGPQYDARNLDQIMGREGKTSEQILALKRKAAEDTARLKNSSLDQGAMRVIDEYANKIAKAQDEDEISALTQERDARLKTITSTKQELQKRSTNLPNRFSIQKTDRGFLGMRIDPETKQAETVAIESEGRPVFPPARAPRSESPTATRKSAVETGLNKVLRETFAALGSQGGTELQRLQVAKENIGKFYQNDPAVAPFAAEISSRIDQLIKSGGAATTTVDKNVKTEEQKKNQNDPERAQARKELLTENKGARIPSSAEITARVEQNRKKKQGGSNNVLPPEAVSKLKEGEVTTFRNGQRWTLKNGQPAQVN